MRSAAALGRTEAWPRLLELAADKNRAVRVRKAAATALGEHEAESQRGAGVARVLDVALVCLSD